jgi:iron complex outermembrane receptor protein
MQSVTGGRQMSVFSKGYVASAAVLLAMSGPVMAQEQADSQAGADEGVQLAPVEVKADAEQESKGYINKDAVSSTGKTSVSVQDSPMAITVIEEQFIRDSGARNIEDALRYSSGVYAGNFGFDNRGDWAVVRGLDASNYLDGLRSLYGSYNSVRPNIYGLEKIEVLKGPSSTLYGQAELGGIINAVSKLPKAERQGELWAQLGSYDRTQIAADVTGTLSEDGKLLGRFVGLKRESGTQVDYVEHNGDLIAPSLTWKPSDDTSITVLVNRQVNQGAVGPQFLPAKGTINPAPRGDIPVNTFVGEPGWDRFDREKTEVTLFLEQRLNDNWMFKATARDTDTRAETREHWVAIGQTVPDSGDVVRQQFKVDKTTDIFNADVRLEGFFDLGNTWHNLAFGVDRQNALWEEDNYYSAATGGTINLYEPVYGVNFNAAAVAGEGDDRTDNKIKQTGIYVIDHMEIGKTVVSTALRHDKSENTEFTPTGPNVTSDDSATTGRLGVMYRFDNGASPYVSYSESFMPNLGTSGGGEPGALDPTIGEQTEVGLKYLNEAGDLSVDVAWFDIEEENRVVEGGTNPQEKDQIGSSVEGFELQVKKRWGRLEAIANLTKMDAVNENSASGGEERLPFVAEELASLWGKYEFANGVRAGVGGRYIGDTVGFDYGTGAGPDVPSVTLYDAMLGYSVEDWDFSVNVHNLTDEVYVSWCRGQAGSTVYDCGYGETRNVTANLRYNF